MQAEKSVYAGIREQRELSDELQETLHAEVKKALNAFAPSTETAAA
jgi:hypothetical protein